MKREEAEEERKKKSRGGALELGVRPSLSPRGSHLLLLLIVLAALVRVRAVVCTISDRLQVGSIRLNRFPLPKMHLALSPFLISLRRLS